MTAMFGKKFRFRLPFRFRLRLIVADEYQPLRTVPWWLWLLLFAALAGQVGFARYVLPPPEAKAEALPAAPSANALRLSAFGDPPALARVVMLNLQGYDNQRGVSVPFRELDYDLIGEWLDSIVAMDERAEYPHFSASKVYGVVTEPTRRRKMLKWVTRQFLRCPDARWEWMAFSTNLAYYELEDKQLALQMAEMLRTKTTPGKVPSWTRQLEVWFREKDDQYETAVEMMSQQLLNGEITEPHEFRFTFERLKGMLEEMRKKGIAREDFERKAAKLNALFDRYIEQELGGGEVEVPDKPKFVPGETIVRVSCPVEEPGAQT